MINKFKKISWIALIGIFFLSGYFHEHLLTEIYQYTIQAYVLANFGCKINYEKAYMDGNRLIIDYPSLPNDHDFKAEQMALAWSFNLRKKEIYISVDFEKPSWKLDANQNFNEEKLKKVFKGKKGGLKYFFDLTVTNGQASWTLPDQSKHQVHFDAKTSSKSGGYIKTYFDQVPDSQHYISISTSSTPDLLAITWECHEIECAHLFTFIKLFFPAFEKLNVTSGILKGKVQTNFPGAQRPYMVGEMLVENICFIKESSFTGNIEKAVLKLEKNDSSDQLITTIVQLDILEPMSLASYDQEIPIWEINELVGRISLDGNKMASLQLDCQTHDQSHFKLTGDINLDSGREFNVNLHAGCSSNSTPEGHIRLLIHQLNTLEKKAEIEIANLSSVEAGFLQTLLSPFIPSAKNLEFHQGTFNGFLELLLTKEGLNNLQIKHFNASNVAFKVDSIHAEGAFDQISGKGEIHLANPNPWETLNVDFNFDDGSIKLEGLHQTLPLTKIQAHLIVQKGALHHSLITLMWMGLKGVVDLEWGKDKELMTFNLDGHVHDISHLFPERIQQALNEDFANSRLKILANLKGLNQRFDLSGTLHVQRNQSDQFDLIHFGCEFQKIPKEKGVKWTPAGWIYAYDLPLEKYVSPFIFRKGVLRMWGKGEFRGSFDHQNFTLLYNAYHLKIENENLLIEAKDLRSDIPGQMMGYHHLDLDTYAHEGSLPIKHAHYFEKNSGLNFSDISGTFLFDNQTLTIHSLETYCHGAFLAGNIFLDYSDPGTGVFNVKLDVPQISGTVSQAQFLLSHLEYPSFLNNLPLEGYINSREQGMQLAFDFFPHDYKLHAAIQATLSDGCISMDEAELALKGLYIDIDYNHQDQCLEMSDIQGTLLVGKPSKAEEYSFGGDYIRLKDLVRQDINLDLWIRDSSTELLRINGYTFENEPGLKEIVLNPDSHISSIYPDSFFCRMRNWQEFDSFSLKSNFELTDLINDLVKFKQTGLYCFSHSLLNKLSQFDPLRGKIVLDINFDPAAHIFRYLIRGEELRGTSFDRHHCLIKGHKLDKKWIIDHLQWDDLIAHAELQAEQGYLKIPFLGLNAGHSLLMGLEGDLFLEENYMRSKINLFEISIADLKRWSCFSDFIDDWQPEGKLRAAGDMRIEFISQEPWFKIDANLLAELPKCTFRQCPFSIMHPFRIHYKTNEVINVEQLHLSLCKEQKCAQVTIPLLNYNPDQDLLRCPQLTFQIPSTQMGSLGQNLHRLFPDLVDDQFKESLINLKPEGEFKGSLGFERNRTGCKFSLKLDDGIYKINEQNYDLKNAEFNQANNTLHFSAFSHEERCPYHILGIINWPGLNAGEASFIDLISNTNLLHPPLNLKFTRDAAGKILIQSMQGYFCGMNLNLKGLLSDPVKSEMITLQGKIDFDFNQIGPILHPLTVQHIRDLELGSIFTLQGDYGYNSRSVGLSFLDRVFFRGTISSKELILKSFQFQKFSADLFYQPKQLKVTSLNIVDEAGKVQSDHILIKQNEQSDTWWFSSPLLVIKNFRPYLLRNVADSEQNFSNKYKSFLIKQLELQNLHGQLSDVHTWQAKGNFHFLNPSRKNINHPLLAIPAEIILRLGLNPQVLNPVTGTVFFDMQGDRFYLSRFKDVYSEGRGSKFYLAESPTPSWIDLKGNANIQIKMKQYNLLFKLAELFTVSMEGNIKKPKFSLQKYKPARKEQPEQNLRTVKTIN